MHAGCELRRTNTVTLQGKLVYADSTWYVKLRNVKPAQAVSQSEFGDGYG
jgi:hypothetical protein